MLQEANQPFLVDFIEERSNVGVQNPVHVRAVDPDSERIERIMRTAPRSESIREPEEVYLVDRVEHDGHRSLDYLVFQSCDRNRLRPQR